MGNEDPDFMNSASNTIMVQNSHTFIVVPFYYEEGTFTINNWWEKEDSFTSQTNYFIKQLRPRVK